MSSFFGFDTRLPRDRHRSPQENNDNDDDGLKIYSFAELEGIVGDDAGGSPAQDDDEDDEFIPFPKAGRRPPQGDRPAPPPLTDRDAFSRAFDRLEAARRANSSSTSSAPTPASTLAPAAQPPHALSVAELEAQLFSQLKQQHQQTPPASAQPPFSPGVSLAGSSAPQREPSPMPPPPPSVPGDFLPPPGANMPFPPPHMIAGMPHGMPPQHMVPPPPAFAPGGPPTAQPPFPFPPMVPPPTAGAPFMPPPGMTFPPASMSLEEVERMMIQQQQMHKAAQERVQHEAHIRQIAKYKGVMTQADKDLVARIQISQLVTSDPMTDDFYYQVYSALRGTGNSDTKDPAAGAASKPYAPPPVLVQRGRNARNAKDGGASLLQDQIQRIVQNAKKRPKSTHVSLEGALGKISVKSSKNPRQLLQVTQQAADAAAKASSDHPLPPSSYANSKEAARASFRVAETLYALVIEAEQLKRARPTPQSKRTRVVLTEDGDERLMTLEEETEAWDRELTTLIDKLWGVLNDPTTAGPTSSDGSAVPARSSDAQPVVLLLSCNKGKKLWPRLMRILPAPLVTMLVVSLFAYAQQLDVHRHSSIPALYAAPALFPGMNSARPSLESLLQFVDATETFMHFVVPSVVSFIADASWDVVVSCIDALLARNNIVRLGAARTGLTLLTMLVSRAEILHQGGLDQPNKNEDESAEGTGGDSSNGGSSATLRTWPDVFPHLFAEMQGHYLALFPVTSIPTLAQIPSLPLDMVPPTLVRGKTATGASLEHYLTDDVHVWRFLASFAVAAGVDQQHALVAEVRERILANVVAGQQYAAPSASSPDEPAPVETDEQFFAREKAERAIRNVNLFLHALGLDASQIRTS